MIKHLFGKNISAVSSDGARDSDCHNRQVLEKSAMLRIQERQVLYARRHPPIARSIDGWHAGLFWGNSVSSCHWTLSRLPSLSVKFDGGKWTCGLEELVSARPISCIAYSIGSNFDRSFEDEVTKISKGRCEVHIYDSILRRDRKRLDHWVSRLPRNVHFHEWGIVGKGNAMKNFPVLTLLEAMKKNGHQDGIDI